MRARANSASAPLTSWAISVGGIFKTPPSGGLLLALSLASAFPLIHDLGGDDSAADSAADSADSADSASDSAADCQNQLI